MCRRVRELRTERGWSLEELSTVCGVSRSMLSQIERRQTNPTLAVILRIAHAFEMSLDELVDAPKPVSAIEVIRAKDPAFRFRSDTDCQIRTLSPLHLEKDVEFYELRLGPGGELRSAAHFDGTREYVTVQRGKVRIESEDETTELGRGDSASYRADVSHAIVNAGRGEAVVFLVDIYQ
ncbi:MAG: helix-turn-helix transcriptional regulator [Planctomycetes bacterium]|nr:helix-turn-helix transcriptional regulator [Planctomycetota bacterium]MBL7041944.1 helix-turn-helix domain-containing protein [Pirellulaceae bacterium]